MTFGDITVIDTKFPTYTSMLESADPLELGNAETITITSVADLSGILTVLLAFEESNHTMINKSSETWQYSMWIPGSTGNYS